MRAAQWYLRIVAGILFVFALLYLFLPMRMAEATGLMPDSSGLADIRATYGGIQLGFAIYLYWGSLRADRYASSILSISIILTAVFVGRVFGVAVEGVMNGFHAGGLAFELITGSLGFYLYRQLGGG